MFCGFDAIEEKRVHAVEKAKQDTTIKDLEKITGVEEVGWRPRNTLVEGRGQVYQILPLGNQLTQTKQNHCSLKVDGTVSSNIQETSDHIEQFN